jgi:hypothetical protein
MRKMPQLTPGLQSTQMTSAFRGYNHNEIIADGEMFDMMNLCGDKYPVLSPRHKRGISSFDVSGQDPVLLTGIHGRDQLVFVRGTKVFYDFLEVTGLTVSDSAAMQPKKIVSMGAYVCIWPDKVYFNTANMADYGSMEKHWTADGTNVSLIMCRGDGTNYDMTAISTGINPPADPENGDMWIDESSENDVLRQYSAVLEEWVEVASTYVKISGTGIGSGLKEYDAIDIAGLTAATGSTEKIAAQVAALNGSKVVYFAGDDYIVVAGLISQAQEALEEGDVTADQTIPDMDFVVESNNRLWGCKYGLVNGQVINEIKCSALGDFRNWSVKLGLSTDSWAGGVGTDGVFTGAATQRGYPVFFKENAIHSVSGTLPNNFGIQTKMCRGVQKGCWRSVQVVGENLYYKARTGVMLYDGNMPVQVSDQLGEILYSDARAGVLGEKYYISMMDKNENWRMFVYDTKYGNWWKEDTVQALGFGTVDDELFYIDEDANTLVSVMGSVGTEEDDFDWAAEFGLTGVNYQQSSSYDDPRRIRNAKYLKLFKIRMFLDPEGWMQLWIKYDENRLYERIGERRRGHDMRTFILPVVPKRCDHLRFKITGHGDMKVYDLSRIMEVGGDGI